MTTKLRIYRALEAVLGRGRLMQAGRFLYLGARRELLNRPEANGEYALIGWCLSVLGDGEFRALDIGANLGDWTAELLARAERRSIAEQVEVWAFEPAPAQRATLAARVGSLGVHIEDVALAAAPGEARFVVTGDNSGNNALSNDTANVEGKEIVVPVSTVDLFCRERGIERLSLVKVDTEGNDFNVIDGAREMLAAGGIDVLQFEYNWRWIAFGHALRSVFRAIEGAPYSLAAITQDRLEVFARWHPELDRYIETNYALVHDEVLARLPHARMGYSPAEALIEMR